MRILDFLRDLGLGIILGPSFLNQSTLSRGMLHNSNMESSLRDTLLTIAGEVRLWAEAKTKRADLLGWCAIASAQLFRALKAAGIDCEIHIWNGEDGSSHAYVVVDDHVLDVTATQFTELRNFPVVLMHHREAEVYEFYQSSEVFHDTDSLIYWQKKSKWPPDQIAFRK